MHKSYAKRLLKSVSVFLVFIMILSSLGNGSYVYASVYNLPPANQILPLSPMYSRPALKGLTFNPADPFNLKFLVDSANSAVLSKDTLDELVEYFLAGLTIPESDLWVNLSPYEQSRIAPDALAKTTIGKDMLGQDYVLKQLSASLTCPDSELGQKYWTAIQANNGQVSQSFNKIWIVPGQIDIYEKGNSVFLDRAEFKVMMEDDYFAIQKNSLATKNKSVEAFKAHILPLIEKEVNTGKNFSQLRQLYSALILSAYFKYKMANKSYASYVNQRKIQVLDIKDPAMTGNIHSLYSQAFKGGAYNITKSQRSLNKITKRSYFSGGVGLQPLSTVGESGGAATIHHDLMPAKPALSGDGHVVDVNLEARDRRGASSPGLKQRLLTGVALVMGGLAAARGAAADTFDNMSVDPADLRGASSSLTMPMGRAVTRDGFILVDVEGDEGDVVQSQPRAVVPVRQGNRTATPAKPIVENSSPKNVNLGVGSLGDALNAFGPGAGREAKLKAIEIFRANIVDARVRAKVATIITGDSDPFVVEKAAGLLIVIKDDSSFGAVAEGWTESELKGYFGKFADIQWNPNTSGVALPAIIRAMSGLMDRDKALGAILNKTKVDDPIHAAILSCLSNPDPRVQIAAIHGLVATPKNKDRSWRSGETDKIVFHSRKSAFSLNNYKSVFVSEPVPLLGRKFTLDTYVSLQPEAKRYFLNTFFNKSQSTHLFRKIAAVELTDGSLNRVLVLKAMQDWSMQELLSVMMEVPEYTENEYLKGITGSLNRFFLEFLSSFSNNYKSWSRVEQVEYVSAVAIYLRIVRLAGLVKEPKELAPMKALVAGEFSAKDHSDQARREIFLALYPQEHANLPGVYEYALKSFDTKDKLLLRQAGEMIAARSKDEFAKKLFESRVPDIYSAFSAGTVSDPIFKFYNWFVDDKASSVEPPIDAVRADIEKKAAVNAAVLFLTTGGNSRVTGSDSKALRVIEKYAGPEALDALVAYRESGLRAAQISRADEAFDALCKREGLISHVERIKAKDRRYMWGGALGIGLVAGILVWRRIKVSSRGKNAASMRDDASGASVGIESLPLLSAEEGGQLVPQSAAANNNTEMQDSQAMRAAQVIEDIEPELKSGVRATAVLFEDGENHGKGGPNVASHGYLDGHDDVAKTIRQQLLIAADHRGSVLTTEQLIDIIDQNADVPLDRLSSSNIQIIFPANGNEPTIAVLELDNLGYKDQQAHAGISRNIIWLTRKAYDDSMAGRSNHLAHERKMLELWRGYAEDQGIDYSQARQHGGKAKGEEFNALAESAYPVGGVNLNSIGAKFNSGSTMIKPVANVDISDFVGFGFTVGKVEKVDTRSSYALLTALK